MPTIEAPQNFVVTLNNEEPVTKFEEALTSCTIIKATVGEEKEEGRAIYFGGCLWCGRVEML
jgi:hypothetical protein